MRPSLRSILNMLAGFLFFLFIVMMGCPQYIVYQQKMRGKAELERATQNRQIKVQEALAQKEAAIETKQADSIRAVGVARANEIIGKSLENNEAYLHWKWIDELEKNSNAVIYVPTETGMPIFEASRKFGSSSKN